MIALNPEEKDGMHDENTVHASRFICHTEEVGLQLVDGWMNMIHIFQSLVFLRSFFFCGFLLLPLLLSQGGWIRQYGLDHHVAGGVLQRCELDHIDLVAGAFQFEPPQSVGQNFRELIL